MPTPAASPLGGVARRGIYDNMKTAVDKVKKGKGRIVNERFATMCAHYLYDPDFCNVASGWEKGVVEKNVQDSRRRIWIDAAKIKFGSFSELNAWLGQRCRALWDEVRHPEHTQFSVAEMLEHERAHLMPMPVPFDGYVEKPARASSTCLVSAARNRYSVPGERVGQMVSTRLYPGSVAIVVDDTVVARHDRLSNAWETRYDWQHYIPLLQRKPSALRNGAPFADMPEPLQRLRRGLLRNPGGDRVMAQVLAIVLSAGLDAVLVAIELALESGPPGKVSVEHVVNVLSRLNAQPVPPTAATLLRVNTPPLANTARYDSLRSDAAGAITREPAMKTDVLLELKALRLHGMASAWADLVEQGGGEAGGVGIESSRWLIEHLLQAEGTDRAMRSVSHQMHAAKFPVHRDMAGLDFEVSPVDRKLVETLATTAFTEEAHNVVLVGGPGTGKTHLATAVGVSGITRHGKLVRFYSTVDTPSETDCLLIRHDEVIMSRT